MGGGETRRYAPSSRLLLQTMTLMTMYKSKKKVKEGPEGEARQSGGQRRKERGGRFLPTESSFRLWHVVCVRWCAHE